MVTNRRSRGKKMLETRQSWQKIEMVKGRLVDVVMSIAGNLFLEDFVVLDVNDDLEGDHPHVAS